MLSGLMEMDHGIGTEEHVAVGSCNNNNSHVIKGKRTKRRLKTLSPCVFTTTSTAVTSSCSSASCGGGGGGSFSSTTFEGTTDQEEEDMAKCLILLAQGKREREEEEEGDRDRDRDPNHHHHQQYKLQKAENHVSKSGLVENYECKTCNRTFPSFQALGGHRASHKKPKMQVEKKSSPPPPFPITATATMAREFEEGNYDYKQSNMMMKNIITNAPPVSLELRCSGVINNKPSKPNKPNKIHECSICGSEFTSGQALGGHMRRHRSSNNNNNVDVAVTTLSVFEDVNVRPRNVLELDLNLPALPEDDMFQFPATRESVVLSSAPALVGCHY